MEKVAGEDDGDSCAAVSKSGTRGPVGVNPSFEMEQGWERMCGAGDTDVRVGLEEAAEVLESLHVAPDCCGNLVDSR